MMSYGLIFFTGHYAPQLAEQIYDRNKVKPNESFINLKGFIVRIYFNIY